MRDSNVLKKLRAGSPVLMTSAAFTASPGLCELLGKLDFDCVWIDMEHRPLTEREVFHMIQGARAGDIDTCVRIRSLERTAFARPLEDGASGLMIPHCRCADDARRAVEYARFAPLGDRGVDAAGPDADYLTADLNAYLTHANAETFLVLQIEDKEAAAHVDEIAAVEGADILFLGLVDLTQSLGVPGQPGHPEVRRVVERVAEAAAAHGKHWGCSLGSAEAAKPYFDMGARFFNLRGDLSVMLEGFRKIKTDFNGMSRQKPS